LHVQKGGACAGNWKKFVEVKITGKGLRKTNGKKGQELQTSGEKREGKSPPALGELVVPKSFGELEKCSLS